MAERLPGTQAVPITNTAGQVIGHESRQGDLIVRFYSNGGRAWRAAPCPCGRDCAPFQLSTWEDSIGYPCREGQP